MTLKQKIKEVNLLFRKVDNHSKRFQHVSSLRCIAGCGKCCLKPDIEATILEFMPAAYSVFQQGESVQLLEKLEAKTDGVCIFYNAMNSHGFCSNYETRGLICRLFGFAAKKDKYGNSELLTCKPIKDSSGELLQKATLEDAPSMRDYYMQLFSIENRLAVQYMPINEAITRALELVHMHYLYRNKRA